MLNLDEDGFHYERDAAGIVTITIDMPGPVNAINTAFRQAWARAMDRLEREEGLSGVVLASAKSTFIAGGDIKEMVAADPADKAQWFAFIKQTNNYLRRLEKLPVPVVAAINGAAVGGGLEVCLACNRRIAVNSPQATLGCPEVTIGLFAGGGGVIRSIHMMGLEKALPLMLEGTLLTPQRAQALGWVDDIVDRLEDLIPRAKAWIAANPTTSSQPWDIKGHKIPGGDIWSPGIQVILASAPALLFKKTRGLLPAPEAILTLAAETVAVSFDAALRVQESLFIELLFRPEAKNLMTANFLQLNQVKSGASRPKGVGKTRVGRLGVLGAGMMGQAIAHAAATAGIQVVLKDVSLAAATAGKAYSEKLLEKAVRDERLDEGAKAAVLDLIKPTQSNADLAGCDFIVEAVFENIELKAQVTQEAATQLSKGGIFASNTSTLPITMLAKACGHPESFIGVHFFSPVERMQLVEIIRGEATSDETVARAFDFARQLGKLPIVVRDGPGFFSSRVFGPYMDEGSLLLEDGVDPVLIDALAKQIGMPVGPLAIHDEVSLELTRKAVATLRSIGVYGTRFNLDANSRMADTLIGKYGRGGRHYGGGFYEYSAGGEKRIWPKLYELFHKPGVNLPAADIKDRLLFRPVVETLKSLEDGILQSVADGNIGSLYGIGAPSWTGGYLQFVNTYGLQRFADRTNELAKKKYGERFTVPRIVTGKVARNEQFQ